MVKLLKTDEYLCTDCGKVWEIREVITLPMARAIKTPA